MDVSITSPKPLRITVLHQHYWPEIAATAQILTDMCEDLAERGHEVTVICGQPSYRKVEGLPGRLAARETQRGVAIHRVWSHIPSRRSIAGRLASYGSYFASSLGAALAGTRPDVCFAMSTPPLLLGLSGVAMELTRRVPFVYSVQDLYPDIAIHLGVMREGGLVARSVDAATRLCFHRASALVTLSHGMAERIAAKGLPRDKIEVIPNWADTSAVVPVPRDNEFARAHELAGGEFVILYAGNIGLSQGLESAIAAAVAVRDLPVRFAFVGDGNAREPLVRAAQREQLDNITFLPPQPRERLAALLGSCDVGLVTMRRGVGADLVPSKLYGIMAAARPVLAAVEAGSEVAHVLQRYACGVRVEPESPEALARGVRECFAASGAQRNRWGQNGRTASVDDFSRGSSTRRYAAVLERAAGRTRPESRERAPRHAPARNDSGAP